MLALGRKNSRSVSWIGSLFALGLYLWSDVGQAKRAITVDDLIEFDRKSVSSLRLSPDGRHIAYFREGALWVMPTRRRGEARKIGDSLAGASPQWSPQADRIAYYARAPGDAGIQVFVHNLSQGTSKQLTSIARGIDIPFRLWENDLTWAPDGSRLAFASRAESAAEIPAKVISVDQPMVFTPASAPLAEFSGWLTQNSAPSNTSQTTYQIFLADLHDGSIHQVTHDNLGYFNLRWAPRGDWILCVSNEGRSMEGYGPETTNLMAVDARTGAAQKITFDTLRKDRPRWSADGMKIAYVTGGYYQQPSGIGVASVEWDGETLQALPAISPATFAAKGSSIFVADWEPDGKHLLLNRIISGHERLIDRLDIAVGSFQPAASIPMRELARQGSMTVARNGTLAWMESTPTEPGSMFVLAKNDSNPRLIRNMYPELAELELGEAKSIRWKTKFGEDRQGTLLKPVGYRAGRKYPVIVSNYIWPTYGGGFLGADHGYMEGNQAMAAHGYVVFFPRPRSAWHWSEHATEAERDAFSGSKGIDRTVEDVLSGVEELVRMGIADSTRICLDGFSNGGGVVNFIVTKTDRFRCAVSASGVGVNTVMQGILQGSSANREVETRFGGKSLWQEPAEYWNYSAIFFADRIKTPMLLAVGDEEGLQTLSYAYFFAALKRNGNDVTLLRYPRQGHGFTGAALKDYFERKMAFFDRHLN